MTLALVFLFGFSAAIPPPSASRVSQTAPSSISQNAQAPETKPAVPAEKPTKTPSTKKASRRPPKKQKVADGCKNGSAPGTEAPSSATSSTVPAQTVDPAGAPKTCPPPKIVVQQGGTTEPSVQLAGGSPGTQANQAKNNVSQMLDSVEGNLKKLSSRQLSEGEQDTVGQIHQFVDQSKSAVATGDTERAHTLAWKAQTLSEDLVDPKK